jgi:Zn ribbon nucleic-acid-binding protein/uncharacterized protein YjhX (UPF0386 family)
MKKLRSFKENAIDGIKKPKENDLMGRFVYPSLFETEKEEDKKDLKEGEEGPKMDVVSAIMQYESEGFDTPEEEVALFQELVRTGLIRSLQGSYQRRAHQLEQEGMLSLNESVNLKKSNFFKENSIDGIKPPKEKDLMSRFVFPHLQEEDDDNKEDEEKLQEKAIKEGKCPGCKKTSLKEYEEVEPDLYECPDCGHGYDNGKNELLEGRLFRKRVFEACSKKGAK